MKRKRLIWILAVVVIIIAVILIFVARGGEKKLQLNTRVVSEGTVENSVMATGFVQPVDRVEVGTQVSGVIRTIYVDFNSHVKRGQLLAELDKSTLNEQVSQAKASLVGSQSQLLLAQQNYDRTKQLFDAKAATAVSLEEATNTLSQAKTSVVNAQAHLHQMQVNLSYADITSPIDGVVLDRAVEAGQTVAASFSTPTLFTIANNLTNMQVEADVDEADIGRVNVGQKVTFTVDAYPDETFNGEVSQVRLQAKVTNNVVTYTVIINAPNPDEKLFPNMTATVNIVTNSSEGLVVPVEAMNFHMTPEIWKAMGGEGAIPSFESGRQVWVVHDGKASIRQIETGANNGVNAIATSGLSDGEEVILSASLGNNQPAGRSVANPLMPTPRGGPRR